MCSIIPFTSSFLPFLGPPIYWAEWPANVPHPERTKRPAGAAPPTFFSARLFEKNGSRRLTRPLLFPASFIQFMEEKSHLLNDVNSHCPQTLDVSSRLRSFWAGTKVPSIVADLTERSVLFYCFHLSSVPLIGCANERLKETLASAGIILPLRRTWPAY